ncbi:MAG: transposase, partial [Proteobacteria bacterium]|nr:transposase [Pseudomonadota bacterium]
FKTIHERQSLPSAVFRNELDAIGKTIVKTAIDEVPSKLDAKGKERKREAKNMANRFRLHGEAYFEFITTPGIDPTNNTAEGAIRFVVIDRHITQGTRSVKGRKANERLWTVVATCALQGRSIGVLIIWILSGSFGYPVRKKWMYPING